ncbi:DUF397 domain-containing protein [Actinoallomurus sp. NPDC052274]|uniref:DUF397 domain-containing protein n=1 Tax=Actinoallomurus sp. NPDC052274 TaxID=3155420 RepID=UPI0034406876
MRRTDPDVPSSDRDWRKSRYSNPSGCCVELARVPPPAPVAGGRSPEAEHPAGDQPGRA